MKNGELEIKRKKISVAMSSEVLAELDQCAAANHTSRSRFIETVLRDHFRRALNARDVELINANADYLNREVEDVLRYQAPIDFTSEEQ